MPVEAGQSVNDGKPDKPDKPGWQSQAVIRESIEAVAIAFILAFLFRTFEAEAFVIPTGSMATTLMGQHKDVVCPMCGYNYQVSASNGLDSQTGAIVQGSNVFRATCPICGYDKNTESDKSFSGDRILVNKFVYCLEEPKRWDVAVFKYPEGAKTNFIKRIAGLPNETIRIHHGDLFVRKDGEEAFTIARKPAEKLRAMLRTVYDNDRVLPDKLLAEGWPARWQPTEPSGSWVVADDYKSFSNKGASEREAWLRYRHIVPTRGDWKAIGRGMLPPDYPASPQLISDFCEYNSGVESDSETAPPRVSGLHWVGDLAVSCTAEVRGGKGQLVFELIEGGRQMQCRIDVATGQARLTISGESFERTGATPVAAPGTYEILFSNVDDQLRLWVNDRQVAFDKPTAYGRLGNTTPQEADRSPVGIASVGADVTVSHLKVLRDLYYITSQGGHRDIGTCDYVTLRGLRDLSPEGVREFLSNPGVWPEAFSDEQMPPRDFPLKEDQFLMLGDNSAQSKDSRLWESGEYYVARELLIGKALFIYWPHSWHRIPGTKIPFPFFPNFERMEFVR